MTFAIVGGGPTAVEMAGAIAELARKALSADLRFIDARSTRVTLIVAGARLVLCGEEAHAAQRVAIGLAGE